MQELEYPFDSDYIISNRKAIRKKLLSDSSAVRIHKKIAVLGGSTTDHVKNIMELFLLNYGIEPEFYQSEYAQYWQDIMFDNEELSAFSPDLIYIHTSVRNIKQFPAVLDTAHSIDRMLENEYHNYEAMWEKIRQVYGCPVIQNNFEQPFYRLLGNQDVSDIHGKLNYVNRLNEKFYRYSQQHEDFYINDINYLASCYGLVRWSDPFYWHMYKYACAVLAIPELSFNVANIIKSMYGRNKKGFVLDLDNTLWGGVVGDDGAENIEIGQETNAGQMYCEFQSYLKQHKDLGILLTVDSKNDEENALAGLNRPDSVLKPEDFAAMKANWQTKDRNLLEIAAELNIGTDALVFVDDNPAERHIVRRRLPGTSVPELDRPEHYIHILDRSGFFEVTNLSEDDLKRNAMYRANAERIRQEAGFADYGEYLRSLEMTAEIKEFAPMYLSRIAQLTNKSNQFNLTTKRCSLADIERMAADPSYIALYGRLADKFGDNGVVSVVSGHVDPVDRKVFHIDLWLMSCRVLKRNMEFAMMDALVKKCIQRGICEIYGCYYPTAKNKMVKEFYKTQGFAFIQEDQNGNTMWLLDIADGYVDQNQIIKVED